MSKVHDIVYYMLVVQYWANVISKSNKNICSLILCSKFQTNSKNLFASNKSKV